MQIQFKKTIINSFQKDKKGPRGPYRARPEGRGCAYEGGGENTCVTTHDVLSPPLRDAPPHGITPSRYSPKSPLFPLSLSQSRILVSILELIVWIEKLNWIVQKILKKMADGSQ